MIQIFAAVGWMQIRSLWNGLLRSTERDLTGTVLTSLAVIVMVGSSLGFSAVVLVMAFLRGRTDPTTVTTWVLGITFLFTLVQAASGDRGFSIDLRRFLVLPIGRTQLAALELIASALAPAEWVFFPVLFALVLGLTAATGVWTGIVATVGVLATLSVAVMLQRILINATALGGRRSREVLGVLLVLGWIGVTFTFAETEPGGGGFTVISLLRATPPDLAARLVKAAAWNEMSGTLGPGLALAGWVVGSFVVHTLITLRLIAAGGSPGNVGRIRASKRNRTGPIGALIPKAALGVAVADLRTLTRLPVMWLLLILPGMLGLFLGGVGADIGADGSELAVQIGEWVVIGFMVGSPGLLANVILLNMFGTDQEGVGHYVLFPNRPRSVFVGKAISRLIFVFIQLGLLGVGFLLRGLGSPLLIFAGMLGGIGSAVWVLAVGNFTSVRLPYRLGQGMRRETSVSSNVRSLFGQVLGTIAAGPALTASIVGIALGGAWAAIAASSGIVVMGVVLFVVSANIAGGWLLRRGPQLLEDLSREP